MEIGTVGITTIIGLIITLCISVGVPIVVMILAKRKLPGKMMPVLIGAVTFLVCSRVLESILHFFVLRSSFGTQIQNNIWLYALYGGLAAAVFEELGRYFAMKLFMKKSLSKENAIMYGIGHGGIESIFVIGLAYVSNLVISVMINTGQFENLIAGLEASQRALVIEQYSPLWNGPTYLFYLAGLERILAFVLQICLSFIVYRAVKERKTGFLFLALALHFIVDAGVVVLQSLLSFIWVELFLAVVVVILFLLLLKWYRKEKQYETGNGTPDPSPL
ncbi:MAG: YhfC family intramembrane metalloprotease [Lachnospiraceae bacterium]|nr:YhfC family intramembrane metalloprotease [Lachnospiraceae bacterium]